MAETTSLAQRMDLPAAVPLLNDMRKSEGPIILDGSETKILGALCLQILISTSRQAKADGREFKLTNLTDEAVGQLASMGISPEQVMEGGL